MDEFKIKPCPFCGGETRLGYNTEYVREYGIVISGVVCCTEMLYASLKLNEEGSNGMVDSGYQKSGLRYSWTRRFRKLRKGGGNNDR